MGGKTIGNRAKHLVKIASAYSADELLMEPGVGPVNVTKIKLWHEEPEALLHSTN